MSMCAEYYRSKSIARVSKYEHGFLLLYVAIYIDGGIVFVVHF